MTFDISKISIPKEPGIYLMKDSKGEIIYIGKAKNLKNRVKSYFLKNQNYKTQKLVSKIADIEFVLTDNESEAFLLESNMIKRYRPTYNIELKDQQRYTYLRITNERFPRLLVARRTRNGDFLGKGKIFGPFTKGSSKLLTIGSLRKSFKVRICKTLPKKACLEYHIGNCDAPCEFKSAQIEYEQNISDLESILKSKQQMKEFSNKLQKQMKDASESQQFERAIEIRDTLQRLGGIDTGKKMESIKKSDEEFFGIGYCKQEAIVMTFRKTHGVIRDSEKFSFDLIGDNNFGNFLYQYYTTHEIPKVVVTSENVLEKDVLENALSERAGYQVRIVLGNKGKRKEMIELIIRNIELIQNKDAEPGLIELRDVLKLPTIPHVIECFDVSNHGDEYAVGSMARFVDAKPNKSGYRKFKIKTVSGRDDFSMINEIVGRRYWRLRKEKSEFPDLIVIDGGKGQLSVAISALKEVGVDIPCVSLAKENEEIFVPKRSKSIVIAKNKDSLKILQYARDEAHRFGVAYNRKLRKIN